MPVALCWLCLALAVVLASAGISLMKATQIAWPAAGMLAMYVLAILSYYFRSKAVIKIPVGVAYAVFEAGGLALVAVVGVFALNEPLSGTRIAAMLLLLLGAWLLHRGTDAGREG